MNICKTCSSPTETRILFTGEYEHCVKCESPKKPDKEKGDFATMNAQGTITFTKEYSGAWLDDSNKAVPIFMTPGRIIPICEHTYVYYPSHTREATCGECGVKVIYSATLLKYVEKK